MSAFEMQAAEDWKKVPRNDVQRQLDMLREQYRTALRNCEPQERLDALWEEIEQCERLLR